MAFNVQTYVSVRITRPAVLLTEHAHAFQVGLENIVKRLAQMDSMERTANSSVHVKTVVHVKL